MAILKTTVSKVKNETHDTVTLTLDLNGADFKFKAGQAVNIDPYQFKTLSERLAKTESQKGEPEMPRSFSISSSPHETKFIELTVKEEKSLEIEPVLSPFLTRQLRVKDEVEIQGPFGLYTPPLDLNGFDLFIHICAGSGISPNRGIIKFCNTVRPDLKHILFFQTKTEEDIIYKDEIPLWKNLKFIPVLSRPLSSWSGAKGYLTREHLTKELDTPYSICAFICGPNKPGKNHSESFIKKYKDMLIELGVSPKNIKTEVW